MSRNTSNQSGGNDGTWFLEAIGAMDRTPSPIEEVERLEAENTVVDTPSITPVPQAAPDMAFDGDPGTSTSSFRTRPTSASTSSLDRSSRFRPRRWFTTS